MASRASPGSSAGSADGTHGHVGQGSSGSPDQFGPAEDAAVDEAHLATMKRIATSEYQHWGYPNPYPYQVHCFCQQFDPCVAIDRKRVTGCPYAKQLVVQRTGYGKSALLHAYVGAVGGIALLISPLLMLSNDLMQKIYQKRLPNVNVIHLDDYNSRQRADLARRHLESVPPPADGRAATVVIASPQIIASTDKAHIGHAQLLIDLHQQGLLSLVILDELHYFISHGLTFRDAFVRLLSVLWTHIFSARDKSAHPRLLMTTATFDAKQFDLLEIMLGIKIPKYDIVWAHPADFARPYINLTIAYGSLIFAASKMIAEEYLLSGSTCIFYTNTRDKAIKSQPKIENALDAAGLGHINVLLVHGNMERDDKLHYMRLFTGEERSQHLRNPTIIICTQGVAGAGIDLLMKYGVIDQLPQSIQAYNQTVGRVLRDGNATNGGGVHLTFCLDDFAYLWSLAHIVRRRICRHICRRRTVHRCRRIIRIFHCRRVSHIIRIRRVSHIVRIRRVSHIVRIRRVSHIVRIWS